MADHDQWVNLEKDPKFVEDEVKALARAGALHVEVQMKKGTKPNLLKVRVTPVSEPNKHSATEQGRNTRFTLLRTRKVAVVSKKKFRVEDEIQLPAAGGNKYKVEGKVKKKVVESAKHVISWRKIYYQVVHMAGVSVPPLASMEADHEVHFIKMKMKDAPNVVPFSTNTDSNTRAERNHVVQTAASGYTMDRYEPYTVCVFFVNMIADTMIDFVVDPTMSPAYTLGPGIFSSSGEDISFKLPEDKYLWWGLNTIDDARNGGRGNWLTPGSAYFQGDDGVSHRIPDTDVLVDTSKRVSALGGFDTLKIRLPWSARNLWSSKTIRFGMTLKVVLGFTGGYSEPNVNLITVAASAWWQPNTVAEQLQVLNHEMGHKLGMVPDGTGKELDRPANFYTGQGHQGPHCANNAVYNSAAADPWEGPPTCVMFGATSCHDPAIGFHRPAPSTYCPDCQKLVKKLDLYGSDLYGFRNSVRRGHI